MDKVLNAIFQFRSKEIDFQALRGWLVPYAIELELRLGYERRDFQNDLDNWFEYIEYAYKIEDQRELTLLLCTFIEDLINNEPQPIVLPRDDQVVREHLLKNSS